jgi:hypothetical protein
MKQLKAVPASGPSEDQSRRLVRLDLEIDPSPRMRTQTPRADENEPS